MGEDGCVCLCVCVSVEIEVVVKECGRAVVCVRNMNVCLHHMLNLCLCVCVCRGAWLSC